jgi:hypothetical protein
LEVSRLYATIGADLGGLEKGYAKAKTIITSNKDIFISSLAAMAGADARFNDAFAAGWSKIAGVASAATGVLTGDYEKLGAALGSLPGPIGIIGETIGSTLGKATQEFVTTTEAMRLLSQQTSASTEFLSGFSESAKDVRVNTEALNSGLRIFSRNLGGITDAESMAATGGKGLAAVLQDQHITMGGYEETLLAVADRIHELGPSTDAAKLATQAFGKSGQELLPILLEGSAAIRERIKEQKELGLVITETDVKSVAMLKIAEDALDDTGLRLGRTIAKVMVPSLLAFDTAADLIVGDLRYLTNGGALWTNVIQRITEAVGKAKQAEQEHANQLQDSTAGFLAFENSVRTTRTQYDLMPGSIRAMIDATDTERSTQTTLRTVYDTMPLSIHNMIDATNKAAEADKQLADKQADLATKFGLVGGAIDGQFGKLTKAQEAQTAFKLATGQTTVAQVETELAARGLTKAYIDGKINLDQFVKSSKDLATGNVAEPFFALQEAGGKSNLAVVGVVKQLRGIEKAAGVSGQSVLSYADSLKIVTGSYHKAATGTQAYEQALAAADVVQIKNSQAVSDARQQYDKGQISVEQYAATKAKATVADQDARTALDAVKKSMDSGGVVTWSKVIDTAAQHTGAMAGSAKNVADSADLMAQKLDAAKASAAALSTTSLIPAGVGLPSEVTMHQFDVLGPVKGTTTTAAGEIPAGAAQGITQNQQEAIDAMTAMATGMQDAFTTSWGIKSPSTVAAAFSTDINAGIVGGLESTLPLVTGAFDSLKAAGVNAWTSGPWTEIGAAAGDQIVQGVKSKASVLRGLIKGIIQDVLKDALGGAGGPRGYGNNP